MTAPHSAPQPAAYDESSIQQLEGLEAVRKRQDRFGQTMI